MTGRFYHLCSATVSVALSLGSLACRSGVPPIPPGDASGAQPLAGLQLASQRLATQVDVEKAFIRESAGEVVIVSSNTIHLGRETDMLGSIWRAPKKEQGCDVLQAKRTYVGLNWSQLKMSPRAEEVLSSRVIAKEVAGSVSALKYLEASLEGKRVASVEVKQFSQSIVHDDRLRTEIRSVAMSSREHCMWIVHSYAAQYISARVFAEDLAQAAAGVLGINVGGKYYASDNSVHRGFVWAFGLEEIALGGGGLLPEVHFSEAAPDDIETFREVFGSATE